MKKHLFALLLLLLSTIFLSAGLETSVSQAPALQTSVPSYGVISSPKSPSGWEKTVTWSDGTKETIEIDKYGRVFLNGVQVKPFGFCGFLFTSSIPEAIWDNILTWMVEQGIRFSYWSAYAHNLDDAKATMDFYFPKFKANKMFIRLEIRNSAINRWKLDSWSSGFSELIDYIDANGWSDMIYAINISHELDRWCTEKTLQDFKDFLDEITRYAKDKLSTSQIGSIPVCHALNGVTITKTNKPYLLYIVEKTDVLFKDFYAGSITAMEAGLAEYRSLYAEGGKDTSLGYKIWYERGYSFPTDNSLMTPENFVHLRDQYDTGDIYLWHIWEGWQSYATRKDYQEWFFDVDGNAESWTENLAPHFPKTS